MNKITTNGLLRYFIYNDMAILSRKVPTLWIAVLIYILGYNPATALTIDNSHDSYLLTSTMSWFEDADGLLTFNDISSTKQLKKFIQHKENTFNLGFKQSSLWFHIVLEQVPLPAGKTAKKRVDTPWFLTIDYPLLDLIDIYTQYSNGKIDYLQLGDNLPFHQRPINSINFVSPIPINEGETIELFIRVQSSSLMKMPISLHSSKSMLKNQVIETSIYSMYFGIMMVMVLYNIFIYCTVRESSYIFYILHISFIILWQAAVSGHTYAYIWPHSAHWAQFSLLLFLSLACYCLLRFSQHFFSTWDNFPISNILLTLCSGFSIASIIIVNYISHQSSIVLGIFLLTICISSAIFVGAISYKHGNRTARFLLLAWSFLLISIAIQIADLFGFITGFVFAGRASLLGTLLEGLLLSLALADRVNDQRRKSQQFAQTTQMQLQASNKELSHALTEVEQSNKLKDQFLGTISHELRTPMNGVEGALELIDTHALGEQQNHYIDIAKISASDMTSVIDSILRFSEIQSGKLQLKSNAFELRALLNPLSIKYRHQCQQKGLSFDYHIDKNVPMQILGDSEQILLVIRQLIDNAIKFTEQGSVKVDLYLQELPKKLLCVTVIDTGEGIPDNQQKHVFQAFRQLDGSDNRKHSGLGIGLTLCHQLTAIMNGSLEIESENQQGTSITFSMPLRESKTTVENSQGKHFIARNNKQKTILIAEDNPINQMILKNMLQTTGCMVLTANNGEQAIQVLESQPVDLIMMDCQMPIIDGFEATRIIRNNKAAYSNIPIIAVTANAMTSDNTRCLRAGMNDYIKKPVNLNVVVDKTKRWLQNDKIEALHSLQQTE